MTGQAADDRCVCVCACGDRVQIEQHAMRGAMCRRNILRLGTLAWIGFVFFYETHQGSSGLEENFQQQKSEACGKTNPLIHLLAPNNFRAGCVRVFTV